MELYPKRKTDEEHVETTRKFLNRSKWFGLLFALGAVCQLVCFAMLWHLIYSFDVTILGVSQGVHIGIMLGAMGGVFIVLSAQCAVWALPYFLGQRTERLMVKFHDELIQKEKASNQASHATSEPAPGAASSAHGD